MAKSLKITVNSQHKLNEMISFLVDFGYERSEGLLHSGQFSLLGGILRIFPVNNEASFALDFFGDYIEKIYTFDQASGKKIGEVSELILLPNLLILSDGARIIPGNYLVHEDYGIGLFESIEQKRVGVEVLTYINLRYLNNDLLRVPENQIDKLTRYLGVGRRRPKLSRLGSVSWQKTYKKTYENILILARELLKLYAERQIVKKIPRKIHQDWARSVENTFGFSETPDQAEAIRAVYNDLEKDIPTDRLVCGDVGFGKTEVAIRAAVQTVANGYQVAILVPTTILAEQHYETIKRRVEGLPINVGHVSRLVEAKKQKETIADLENGKLDILVGTHKLVKSQIKFKNFGLLVVDEEQKFGVKDKEKLKLFRENIDVLTLTATPIPRTLYMALSGIREISQISSIPEGRKSIETVVKKYDKVIIKEYIDRELGRNGQVYYLHNEVRSIQSVKTWLQKEYPNISIEVGHGQMGENNLAEVMRKFTTGEIKILVCSTIIENGLDLSNANTLIVENADNFGLSQLYQIRGRIGRSPKQAYSLFTYQKKGLTQNATKRLKALVENTDLGGGYSIALEDLEIRGGGNILGKEQHGNMEAIGLILYSKLLKLAVEKLKV
ncbi:MAG: DEAD/DEAH box helicase [Candidatus Berkelbacteria bacterium]|nr:DEAD/DEAH box helicase [Candidatus Berkelbacteria bacterium]